MNKKLPRPRLSNPVHLLAFGFGAGLSPVAPGTAGTVVAAGLYIPLAGLHPGIYITITLLVVFSGVWICHRTAKDLELHDHPGIVWDEIAGYLVTMFLAPPGWQWILAGFLLFRLFDIWKPWPINWLDEKVSGGLGIMLDDILAGLYALAILQLSAYLLL